MLSKILGPKREEVTGGWRKLYSDKFRDFNASPYIVRAKKMSLNCGSFSTIMLIACR
jgi:hypothetical protein